jgi:hypothetical protein
MRKILMSKKIFSEREVKLLSKNKYVKSNSEKGITYTDEFKRLVVAENEKGKPARLIFEECGFDVEVVGMTRVKSALKRWKAAYKADGVCGLRDTRKGNSGRTLERELSIEEKYQRLEAELHLVKAENELLKKIQLMKRGL